MDRFVAWHERGEYSCTGTCVDIGITTKAALRRYKSTGDPVAGSTHPRSAGTITSAGVSHRRWTTYWGYVTLRTVDTEIRK